MKLKPLSGRSHDHSDEFVCLTEAASQTTNSQNSPPG